MYYLTNDLAVSPEQREELFKEILSGKMDKNILEQQKRIKIKELNRFGKELAKTAALSANVRSMLCAATLVGLKNDCTIICEVNGEGSYLLESEAFELMLCCLIGNALNYSANKRVTVKVTFQDEKVDFIISYCGTKFTPQYIGRFNVKSGIIENAGDISLSFNFKLKEAIVAIPKEPWDYMSDRFSPVYLGLSDLL